MSAFQLIEQHLHDELLVVDHVQHAVWQLVQKHNQLTNLSLIQMVLLNRVRQVQNALGQNIEMLINMDALHNLPQNLILRNLHLLYELIQNLQHQVTQPNLCVVSLLVKVGQVTQHIPEVLDELQSIVGVIQFENIHMDVHHLELILTKLAVLHNHVEKERPNLNNYVLLNPTDVANLLQQRQLFLSLIPQHFVNKRVPQIHQSQEWRVPQTAIVEFLKNERNDTNAVVMAALLQNDQIALLPLLAI